MEIRPFPRFGLRRASFVLATLLVLGEIPSGGFAQTPISRGGGAQFGGQTHALPFALLRSAPPMAQEAPALQARPYKHPKLSTPLADLARSLPQQRGPIPKGQRIAAPPGFSLTTLPKSVRDAVRARMMRINNDAEVQVYILVTEVTEQNLLDLQNAGVRIELQDKRQRIVQARIPVTRLEDLGALPFVRFVRLPDYGIPATGSVTTEGDAILKADQVRARLGVEGTGVRVGVISDGINGIFATGCTTCGPTTATPSPISSGDLPNATGTRNASGTLTSVTGGITAQSFRGDADLEAGLGTPTGAEGTAMLEIVHDLAPNAQLSFANFETGLEFQQAVNHLGANADIVVDDIGFFAMPYDGTSPVSANTANALNSSTNPIRAYFTAVGNYARMHYQGNYVDSGTDGTPFVGLPGDLHLFQPTADTSDVLGLGPTVTDLIHLPARAGVTVSLGWNDPAGASNNDYDVFLLRSGIFGCLNFPDVVAWSIGPQSGTQDPVEVMGYTNDTAADDDFCIVVQNSQNLAAARTFDMFVRDAPPLPPAPTGETHNYNTVPSSVPAQSDAGGSPASVISVGAANWMTPDDIESFSSNGPTNDGRMKPDVTAVDGVSVTGAGNFSNPFLGTSAAAPHGAGVAALLLQAAPCLRAGASGALTDVNARTNLRSLILNTAVDLGSPGSDNVFGYGRIDALAAANRTIPTANAGPNQTVSGTSASGASVTLTGTASSDPYGCPLTLNWSGTCGNASGVNPTVTCPFGTNAETLTVTNNGVTLSQAASVQITVTNFAISSSPSSATVSPGQSAAYTLSVNPQYAAYNNAVSLACSNLPSRSTCSFSPRTVTPGASGATSNLTISTTAPSASLKHPFGQPPANGVWIGLMALWLIVLAGIRRFAKARAVALYVSAGLLGLLLALVAACGGGGGGGGGPTNPGTPVGTYTITIAGTAGSLQNSGTVTLIVQ
jgi:hypothetical protein